MSDRYNPTNLSWMEEYLAQQVRDGEYDLLANLAILKLSAVSTVFIAMKLTD